MTLIDLSLPLLALLLLVVVLYNVRVEKRRSRAAGHTLTNVAMRNVQLRAGPPPRETSVRANDDDLFDPHPPADVSRH